MNIVIIYDSFFGNTEQVAKTIGDTLASKGKVRVVRIGDMRAEYLKEVNLCIIGSPTRGFRPTPAITDFIKNLEVDSFKSVSVAAFDTRIAAENIRQPVLKLFVKLFKYAAPAIADGLESRGGKLIGAPIGFYVKNTKGPFKDGEIERVREWAAVLGKSVS